MQQGRHEQAEKTFQTALNTRTEVLPDYVDEENTHHRLGMLYHRQGRYQAADEVYTLLGEEGKKADLQQHMGHMYMQQQAYQEALDTYQAKHQVHRTTNIVHNIGRCYQAQAHYQKAIEAYQQELAHAHTYTQEDPKHLYLTQLRLFASYEGLASRARGSSGVPRSHSAVQPCTRARGVPSLQDL